MKLKIWELSLLLALVIAVLWGALLERRQIELSEQLIRLHVVARSETAADREQKLHVRDRVRAEVEPLLEGTTSRAEALLRIEANLPRITAAAEQAIAEWGGDQEAVLATLTRERYPTRAYESFTLPAGRYHSLRVEIGAAGGQNWWCVVFPPLCIEAASGLEVLEAAGLTEGEIALVTGGDPGHALRFRTLELVDGVRAWLGW